MPSPSDAQFPRELRKAQPEFPAAIPNRAPATSHRSARAYNVYPVCLHLVTFPILSWALSLEITAIRFPAAGGRITKGWQ